MGNIDLEAFEEALWFKKKHKKIPWNDLFT